MKRLKITEKAFGSIFNVINQTFSNSIIKEITHTQFELFIKTNKGVIYFSLYPEAPFLGIVDKPNGKRIPIDKSRIKEIKLLNNDKIISIKTETKSIIIELIYRHTNAIVTEDNKIIWIHKPINNSWRKLQRGEEYILPPPPPVEIKDNNNGLQIIEDKKEIIINHGEIDPLTLIKELSKKLKEEITLLIEDKEKEKRIKKIKKEIKRKEKLLQKLKTHLSESENYEKYRYYGELIKGNLWKISKGMKEVAVTDFVNKKEIKISLNPQLSPEENMQKYFHKSKRLKNSIDRIKQQIEYTQKEINKLKEELENPQIEIKEEKKKDKKQIPGIKYKTTNDFLVVCGRNSKENDELTFHYASPKDLFFHCRESAGSHVILFVHTSKGKVQNIDIEEAAIIAAYHSKSRGSTVVPVTYTPRKYVQKIKGTPGLVKLLREEVIMVYNPEENIKRIKKDDRTY